MTNIGLQPTAAGEMLRAAAAEAGALAAQSHAFKVTNTRKWSVPYQYTDRTTGFFILMFQAAVIAPVIKIFCTWSKIRKELKDDSSKRDA